MIAASCTAAAAAVGVAVGLTGSERENIHNKRQSGTDVCLVLLASLGMERGWQVFLVPTSGYGLQRGETELVESLGAHPAAGLAAVIGKLLL